MENRRGHKTHSCTRDLLYCISTCLFKSWAEVRKGLVKVMVAAGLFVMTAANCLAQPVSKDVEDLIDMIHHGIACGSINRLELVQVDPDAHFLTAIDPYRLDHSSDYKLSIRQLTNKPLFKDLLVSLNKPSLSPADPCEIRTGILFFSKKDDTLNDEIRVGAIYFDRTGYTALINGHYFNWRDSPLFQWYQVNFGVFFRFKKALTD